jgi:hypothetical protein
LAAQIGEGPKRIVDEVQLTHLAFRAGLFYSPAPKAIDEQRHVAEPGERIGPSLLEAPEALASMQQNQRRERPRAIRQSEQAVQRHTRLKLQFLALRLSLLDLERRWLLGRRRKVNPGGRRSCGS